MPSIYDFRATNFDIERIHRIPDHLLADILFGKKLPFTLEDQTQTNWCWAATSVSVSRFYWAASTWTQCKVASAELGRTDCCNSPVPSACNVPYYLDRALTRTQNLSSLLGRVLTWAEIQAEIDGGRPVGVRVGWSGGGGHFLAIFGYGRQGGQDVVDVDDPIYGVSRISVDTLRNSYQGSGTWTHSYLTRSYFPLPFIFPVWPRVVWDIFEDVRVVRRVAAGGSRAAAGLTTPEAEAASLSFPHSVYDLAPAAKGKLQPSKAPRAARVVELVGGQATRVLEVALDGEAPRFVGASPVGRRQAALLQAFEQAGAHHERSEKEVELRHLRVPDLYVDAVWVHGAKGLDRVHVVPGVHHLGRDGEMGLDEFVEAVTKARAGRRTDDEALGG